MATELTMPQMGYDMQEGTILKWLKSEGESVQNGEPIAEIETDKAVVEFESYADGVVQAILVSAGTTVPVGEPIAVVGDAAEVAAPADAPADEPAADVEQPVDDEPAEQPSAAIPMPAAADPIPAADEPEPEPDAPVRASPVARRIADERGVSIADVVGTGPGGRVTRDDVVAYADFADATAAAAEEVAPIADEVVAAEEERPEPEPVAEVAEPAAEVVEEEVAVEEELAEEEPVAAAEEAVAEVEEVEEEEQPEPEPVEAVAEPEVVEEERVEPEPVVVDEEAVAEIAEEVAAVEEQVEAESVVVDAEPEVAADDADAADGAIELSRMRRQIARVTLRSKQEKPHFYVTSEVDMTAAMGLRREINDALASEGTRVTVNDMIIKACVDALRQYPKFNAFLDGDAIRLNDSVNVGIAMAVEDGLLMPAIRGCEGMSLREIALASKDLADRAQNGTLRPDEYTGGTFGISNLGMFDVSTFVAIIQPPQSAIVAVGTVAKKPVVRDDEIVVRQVMNATISADHRVVDGAEGAQFLIEVKRRLESPLSLLL